MDLTYNDVKEIEGKVLDSDRCQNARDSFKNKVSYLKMKEWRRTRKGKRPTVEKPVGCYVHPSGLHRDPVSTTTTKRPERTLGTPGRLESTPTRSLGVTGHERVPHHRTHH